MSIIATITCSSALLAGAVVLLLEAGYGFDLRRKPNRMRVGGRRESDQRA